MPFSKVKHIRLLHAFLCFIRMLIFPVAPLLVVIYDYKLYEKIHVNKFQLVFIVLALVIIVQVIKYIYSTIRMDDAFSDGQYMTRFVVKGILESVLDYLGLKNRYSYEVSNIVDMHPGVSAKVLLDRKEIGIIGRVHPNISKDDIYVCEISLKALMTKVKPIKYKEANKYPSVVKDLAFVVDKDTSSLTIYNQIKKSGGRLVTNIEVFDIYDMDNEKSIAYKLTFEDPTRTLNEEEVLEVFNKIIKDVSSSLNAKLRG